MPVTQSERAAIEAALRSQIGRIGAHASWAKTVDRSARTLPARMKLMEKFEDQVDPNRELTPAERAKRAESARKEYYARLALKSAQVRRRRSKSTRAQACDVAPGGADE